MKRTVQALEAAVKKVYGVSALTHSVLLEAVQAASSKTKTKQVLLQANTR